MKLPNNWLFALAISYCSAPGFGADHIILVSGLGGEARLQSQFDSQARTLHQAVSTLPSTNRTLLIGADATRDAILAAIETASNGAAAGDRLQIHLIGHGSHDGREYKFNIPGPDLTAEDLRQALEGYAGQIMLALMTSASGAAMDQLKGDNRLIITATRSAAQKNLSLFSRFWAEGAALQAADVNRNDLIDVQELYEYASLAVATYYEEAALIASEASMIEGNNPHSFPIARVGRLAAAPLTAGTELLVRERDSVEAQLEALRAERTNLSDDEYFGRLQNLMIEMGRIQRQIDAATGTAND